MDVSGQILTPCPPDILVSTLLDVEALSVMLPQGSVLKRDSDGAFAFTLVKDIGPLTLTLPGQLTVSPTGKGHNHTLSARAAHIIGGKVELDLDLKIERLGAQTLLAYSGNLVGSGIAGRLLGERKRQVNAFLRNMLLRVKARAERRMIPDA